MYEMNVVELLVEKSTYAKDGVHKGMQGWICSDTEMNGFVLVNFPQRGARPDIATISIQKNDLRLLSKMDPVINEKIAFSAGDTIPMNAVEIVTEKEEYAKDGVHKGMQGWISPLCISTGGPTVIFPRPDFAPDITAMTIHESDLHSISSVDPMVNRAIQKNHR